MAIPATQAGAEDISLWMFHADQNSARTAGRLAETHVNSQWSARQIGAAEASAHRVMGTRLITMDTLDTGRGSGAFSVVARHTRGREAAAGMGGLASAYFGAGGLKLGQGMRLEGIPALSNPYFSLVPQASHAAIAQRFGAIKVTFGMLTSGLNQTWALPAEAEAIPVSSWGRPKVNATLIEVSKSVGDAAMSFSFSRTTEGDAYLGAFSPNIQSPDSSVTTSSIQIAGAVLLSPKLALAGQASYGMTPGGISSKSLISEVSATRTNAFSVAMVASDRIKAGDQLSVAVSQPMRAYSGEMIMDMLTGGRHSGSQTRERLRFSMVPFGRELRAQLNYQTPLRKDESVGVTLMVRRDPNNVEETSREKLLLVRYTMRF